MKKTKEKIISILEKIDDEKVLEDILALVGAVYKHYLAGNWERH